jgi:predicted nuclease of predicted toxin-antitoxin system
MKFLADMGISPEMVAFLTGLGHDAIHLADHGLGKEADPQVLEKARREGRVLLTHDLDFGELVAAGRLHLPSVIIFRLRNMRPDSVNRNLQLIVTRHRHALEQGAIISVTESQIRVRSLPLQGPQ